MTPNTLLELLAASRPEAPLVFRTDQGEIRGGYHVTELKLADIRSIDCGARQSRWRELSLQLLDGGGGDHMTVGTFRRILLKSAGHVDGLGTTPMNVEFSHENRGMRIYQLAEPRDSGERMIVDLIEARAQCKPAQAAMALRDEAAPPCCGAKQSGPRDQEAGRDASRDRCRP